MYLEQVSRCSRSQVNDLQMECPAQQKQKPRAGEVFSAPESESAALRLAPPRAAPTGSAPGATRRARAYAPCRRNTPRPRHRRSIAAHGLTGLGPQGSRHPELATEPVDGVKPHGPRLGCDSVELTVGGLRHLELRTVTDTSGSGGGTIPKASARDHPQAPRAESVEHTNQRGPIGE